MFNLVAPQQISQYDFTHEMGKAYQAWTTIVAPQRAFRIFYGEAASFLTAGQKVRPTRLLEAGFRFSVPNVERLFKGTDHTTVKILDLKRYMGLWYEIARYENRFEHGLVDVTATYTLRPDGLIRVENRGCKRNSPYDICKTANGHAKIPDPAQPGKLKVSFFLNFYSDYYVLELDEENYNYALVGSSTDKYLWILSRTPQLPEDIKKNSSPPPNAADTIPTGCNGLSNSKGYQPDCDTPCNRKTGLWITKTRLWSTKLFISPNRICSRQKWTAAPPLYNIAF